MSATPPGDNAGKPELQVHAAADLDYKYRDLFNLHVGAEEVILEFGNLHRSQPGHATLLDRIVLSPANAMRLQQGLAQALGQMQQKMRDLAAQNAQKPSGGTAAQN